MTPGTPGEHAEGAVKRHRRLKVRHLRSTGVLTEIPGSAGIAHKFDNCGAGIAAVAALGSAHRLQCSLVSIMRFQTPPRRRYSVDERILIYISLAIIIAYLVMRAKGR